VAAWRRPAAGARPACFNAFAPTLRLARVMLRVIVRVIELIARWKDVVQRDLPDRFATIGCRP
jgi:hypothetical protein